MHGLPLPFRSIVVALACAAACARISAEESPPPPQEQTQHDAMFGQNHEAKVVEGPAPQISDEAKAYLADCHHTFEKEREEMGDKVSECMWREFDQNCSPDPSGCWDKGQACRDACGKPCESCDDTCGDGCDGCMGKCGDDDDCKAECAEARAVCRDKCLAARDKCANDDCSKAEEKCNADHLALREEKCPRCEEINACMNAAIEKEKDPAQTCGKKFKREPAECLEWCFEW